MSRRVGIGGNERMGLRRDRVRGGGVRGRKMRDRSVRR